MKLNHVLAAVCLSGLSVMAQAAETAVPYSLTAADPTTNNFRFFSGQPCDINHGDPGDVDDDHTAPYKLVSYQVTVGGIYNFFDVSYDNDGPDGTMAVYSGNFDPANPAAGCVGSVDDDQNIRLRPGTYTLVLTAYNGMDDVPGDFEYRITPMPVATPVPTLSESLLMALMVLVGACGLGAVAKRQRQTTGL